MHDCSPDVKSSNRSAQRVSAPISNTGTPAAGLSSGVAVGTGDGVGIGVGVGGTSVGVGVGGTGVGAAAVAVGTGTGVSVAAGSSSHATSIETARRLARPIQAVRRTKSPNAVPARNVNPNGCLFLGYAAYLINCLYPLYDCRNPNGQAEAPAPGCSSSRPARPNTAALWSAHRTMGCSSLHRRVRIERALSWWPDTFARDRECNG